MSVLPGMKCTLMVNMLTGTTGIAGSTGSTGTTTHITTTVTTEINPKTEINSLPMGAIILLGQSVPYTFFEERYATLRSVAHLFMDYQL
ncbi:MAG: hypothetical protein ACHQD8_01845 [Chitinophagales bacterium]